MQKLFSYTNILLRRNVQSLVVEKDKQATGRDIWRTEKSFPLHIPFKFDKTKRYTVPATIPWREGEGPSNTDERISPQQSCIQTVFPLVTNTL